MSYPAFIEAFGEAFEFQWPGSSSSLSPTATITPRSTTKQPQNDDLEGTMEQKYLINERPECTIKNRYLSIAIFEPTPSK